MERVILHVDMDAFFASVEQRDHPEWRGKPVIVGAPPDCRGVVSTCSYEARKFGVHSAMPSRQAFACCPQGIFVQPRMARYQEVSAAVFAIFNAYSPLVEALSIDEAFLDVSGVRRLFGEPQSIARKIKAQIAGELGITCSIGVAPNKFLAKLASEERKPNGLFTVPEGEAERLAWLGAKPVRALWGIGEKGAQILTLHGIRTVRDIQTFNPARLAQITSPATAEHLLAIAFGRDTRAVEPEHEEKSFSREQTYLEDTLDVAQVRQDMRLLAEDVGRRIREAGFWAKTGRIKIRYESFRTVTRQARFATPVCDDFALRDMAWSLLDAHLEQGNPVRLIGFGVENLVRDPTAEVEEDLFTFAGNAKNPRERQERLSRTLDALRKRFPKDVK